MRKRGSKAAEIPSYITDAIAGMPGVEILGYDSGKIIARVDGKKIVTNAGQVNLMDDRELKIADLTWNFSETNKLSPQGRIIGAIYETEMTKRKLRPMVNFCDDPEDPESTWNTWARIKEGKF